MSRHPLFATSKSIQQLMSLLQSGEPRPLPALSIPPITLDEQDYSESPLVPSLSSLPTRKIRPKKIRQQYPPIPPRLYLLESKEPAIPQQQTLPQTHFLSSPCNCTSQTNPTRFQK